eukprot:TRINITY_DN20602_c0_g1_i1.p1 TRINITY_DN20602_c0_g1~~TRINITY_DN20602_c0_g1_i1.p1  ORF type:complete len:413 (+),score=26.14 TRINITY_DN20602_c0_g1_i1:89-1240(+)
MEKNMGVKISDKGTLEVDLADGRLIAVREGGVGSKSESNEKESSPSGQIPTALSNVSKIKWEELKVGHVVGHGTQAKVRKVKHTPTKKIYALKSIMLNEKVPKSTVQQELSRVLDSTGHPNVVHSEQAFYIDGSLRILMEYMDLGTVQGIVDAIGFIPEDITSAITKQNLQGLDWLHSMSVLHRDIKPTNLLVHSKGYVKISDFGVSCAKPVAMTMVGSISYMSPERVKADPYGASSDIWSIGVSVAQCLTGVFPLFSDDEEPAPAASDPFTHRGTMFDLAQVIAGCKAKVEFDNLLKNLHKYRPDLSPKDISPEARDFVSKCMQQDADARPKCTELLQHPWIKKYEHIGVPEIKAWLEEKVIPVLKKQEEKEKEKKEKANAH